MTKLLFAIFLLTGLTAVNSQKQDQTFKTTGADQSVVYQSENLLIKKLSSRIYMHISYLDTEDFGRVACNGMFVTNEIKAVVFDTPTDNKSSLELIGFIAEKLESEIIALIPTHFHGDCVGGLEAFEQHNIPVYAAKRTVELLKGNGQNFTKPVSEFDNSITLDVGSEKVHVQYFGEGHTKDNIVGYFPGDKTVFGGCLVKSTGAGKGYLGDANISAWPETVRKVKAQYPDAEIVIPGHGNWGGAELLDYTIELFE